MKTIALLSVILFFMLNLTSCQTASKISEKRDEVALVETQAHFSGACSSNLDILYQLFEDDVDSWNSLFKICDFEDITVTKPQ